MSPSTSALSNCSNGAQLSANSARAISQLAAGLDTGLSSDTDDCGAYVSTTGGNIASNESAWVGPGQEERTADGDICPRAAKASGNPPRGALGPTTSAVLDIDVELPPMSCRRWLLLARGTLLFRKLAPIGACKRMIVSVSVKSSVPSVGSTAISVTERWSSIHIILWADFLGRRVAGEPEQLTISGRNEKAGF